MTCQLIEFDVVEARRDGRFLKKAPQKLLGKLHPFSECRESVIDLTAGEYGVGTFGFSRGVPAKRVEE